ncbi:ATP-binding protein [candidate division CSSED10-310 bacterium]|uniref:histidine kinase n=1 Tax=candidate division CSSED10-310 bacterium TaxID=2855610 RepID=A0ABV6YXX6_UNCC1
MQKTTRSTRESEAKIYFPISDAITGTEISGTLSKVSQRQVIIHIRARDIDQLPNEKELDNIRLLIDGTSLFFRGMLKKIPPLQLEISIVSMNDHDRLVYNNFLLDRFDRQYELSRKVEEIALEEIQQLNKELSLSLKVEEAALAEAQKMNEELLVAQKELINSRNQLEAILNGITDGIYLINKDFHLLALNKKQMEWVAEGIDDPIGRRCYQVFFDLDEPCAHCTAQKTFSTFLPERQSLSTQLNERNVYLEYFSFPINDEGDELYQVVQYVQDVTERKEMEDHLFQTEKMASLGTMTAGIAHELRNPLSSISMTIQLIKKKQDIDAKFSKKIGKIETQVNKAGKILSDIKTFSRKEKLTFKSMEVSVLVDNLLSQMVEMGTLKGVHLERDLQQTASVMVEPDQLDQVVINLVRNAADAMEELKNPTLRVKTGNFDDNQVFISVEDTGEGISEEKLKKIFDPFFTTKPPGKGTGLGLALCYKIIERHRGTIKVHSVVGDGSRFTILLPCA